MRAATTTILICTPDAESKLYRDCLASVCETTKGLDCEIVTLDNRGNKQFNHAREINRGMSFAFGTPIVILDDDTRVQGDWLPAMQEAARPNVAVVACSVYKPTHAGDLTLWSRGWSCGPTGAVHNYKGDIGKGGAAVPAACSCCWLINPDQGIKHKVEEDAYKKYYFDPDYCLGEWTKNRKTIVIPAPVIHLGGGWQRHDKHAHETMRHDRDKFTRRWINSGELEALKELCADQWPADIRWD